MRAWLTPDLELLSNPQDCRKIAVPGDLWYLVQGALELLCIEENWEQHGTATPEQMAQYFMGVVDETAVSECGGESGMFVSNDTSTIEILAMNQSTHPGGVAYITPLSLPVTSPMPTALYCLISGTSSEAVDLRIMDGSFAAQVFDYLDGYNKPFTVVIPFSQESSMIRLLDVPETFSLSVRLFGWW